jgi:uncharacterized repeat protein (TIGR03803 family)
MTPAGDLTLVHAFAANSDGGCPQGTLLETEGGAFYGTAPFGGSSGSGTIFRVTGDSTFDVLYAFPGSEEGRSPTTLLQAGDGAIYGIAAEGGAFNRGTVFRLTDDGSAIGLHSFTGGVDGAVPSALIQATDGTFYGLTTSGGTFFQLAADGSFTALYSFSADRSTSAPPSVTAVGRTAAGDRRRHLWHDCLGRRLRSWRRVSVDERRYADDPAFVCGRGGGRPDRAPAGHRWQLLWCHVCRRRAWEQDLPDGGGRHRHHAVHLSRLANRSSMA